MITYLILFEIFLQSVYVYAFIEICNQEVRCVEISVGAGLYTEYGYVKSALILMKSDD